MVIPDQIQANLVAMEMKKGDPRCPIAIGERVRKIVSEKGDLHIEGDEGEVIGNFYLNGKSAYLIQFDNDASGIETFLTDFKIQKI